MIAFRPALDPREERPDHRGEDRDATERERVQPQVLLAEADSEQHHRNRRDGIGLEQVGRHARAVADVVADVVRDDRRIARIVLRDACLDLPYEVGTDVGRLRVDATPEPREDGDERATEREPDEVAHCRLRRVPDPVGQHPVVARHSEEPETDDQETGDRARAERDLERRLQPLTRRLCGSHVRADRDVHSDETGECREDGADQEPEGGAPPELVVEAEQEERHDRDDRDRRVLLAQIRRSTLLDRASDLLHLLVAGGLPEQPPGQIDAVQDGEERARQREPDGMVYEEVHRSSGCGVVTN